MKNVAPVHFLVRGDLGDLVRFGKSMATEQLSIGNFHSTDHMGNRSQALVDFQPAEKDNALIHGVETAAVMSGYLHVVYNTTRITECTVFRHPHNGQLRCMSDIMNLPEDTIGFEAKAREDRTMNDGTIRKAGERDTFSLRCDDKLSINLPRDRNHPMSANNMRLQTILPLEYKRENTFRLEDVEASMANIDIVPPITRRWTRIGCHENQQPYHPPPRQGAGEEIPIDMDEDAEMLDGQNDEEDNEIARRALEGQNDNIPWDRGINQRGPSGASGKNGNSAVGAGVRQMTAYSASERVPYATLMTGDMQLFAEFPEMDLQKTVGEQWDLGVGNCAILYVVPRSGDWIAGLYGMLVWTWLMFMFVVQ